MMTSWLTSNSEVRAPFELPVRRVIGGDAVRPQVIERGDGTEAASGQFHLRLARHFLPELLDRLPHRASLAQTG